MKNRVHLIMTLAFSLIFAGLLSACGYGEKDAKEYTQMALDIISAGKSDIAIESAQASEEDFEAVRDEMVKNSGLLNLTADEQITSGFKTVLRNAYKKIDTDKKLIIAGGSSDTKEFVDEMIKRAADDERIIFTGFVEGRELEELYSNPYIYVLASDVEGMPLSLLEAMSYGNCVLTSNIPECAEVIEDKGVTFARGSTHDLQKKMQMLLDSPQTVEALRSGSKDFILSKYSWDSVINKTLELYMKE